MKTFLFLVGDAGGVVAATTTGLHFKIAHVSRMQGERFPCFVRRLGSSWDPEGEHETVVCDLHVTRFLARRVSQRTVLFFVRHEPFHNSLQPRVVRSIRKSTVRDVNGELLGHRGGGEGFWSEEFFAGFWSEELFAAFSTANLLYRNGAFPRP